MNLSIHYEAVYTYERAASLSPHVVRVFPRMDIFVHVAKAVFTTAPTADVQWRRDLFDNQVATCFFPELLSELPIRLEMEIEVKERNPFHFLLDSGGLHLPCKYTAQEEVLLAPFLRCGKHFPLPAPLVSDVPRPTMETLVTLLQWVHENLAYERRDEGDPFTPEETLRREAGSCRDFGPFFAEVLRRNGVATRLASGFVWEGDRADEDRRSESALHAWVEAYLPGAGWLGMDPTNGVLSDHHFVTTAVGLEHSDIAPVVGTYFARSSIASSLATKLEVQKL